MTTAIKKRLYIGWGILALSLLGVLVSISVQYASMKTLLDVVRGDQLIVQEQLREGCK